MQDTAWCDTTPDALGIDYSMGACSLTWKWMYMKGVLQYLMLLGISLSVQSDLEVDVLKP